MSDATGSRAAVGPKPWRCELCGGTEGLIERDGLIQCFTIPSCEKRRVGRATPDRAAKLSRLAELSMQPMPRMVRAEFELPEDATDEDVKRLIDAVNAVAIADENLEA